MPKNLSNRGGKPHLIHNELVQLMEWKINRGKFRPLMKVVASNSEESVKQITEKGIATAKKSTEGGIKAICELPVYYIICNFYFSTC